MKALVAQLNNPFLTLLKGGLQLMELKIDLMQGKTDGKKVEKIKKVLKKEKELKYEPTWDEVWFSGFENKKGIFQTKLTSLDKQRLEDVKKAIEEKVIGTQVDSVFLV